MKLVVQGLGEVPSFKNRKVIGRDRKGRPMLFTKDEVKERMELLTKAIEYQLRSSLLIDETGTVMECIPQSRIVSSLPLDDSLNWIGSHSVSWRRVRNGEEGFEIVIEPVLQPPHSPASS